MKYLKILFLISLFVLTTDVLHGQIKIGDNPQNLDPSSLLELESNTRVLVISRISTLDMQQITPLTGSIVYNIDEQCIFFYDGLNWINLCVSNSDALPPEEPDNPEEPTEPTDPVDGVQVRIIDNTDGTYTVETAEGETFTIDTRLHSGAPGALFFGDTSTGDPSFDETNLFWDNENKKLGIGTNTPENSLDVNGLIKASRIHNGRGSPSYPGYHFQDNVTTGMFSIIRNILGFSTDGMEAMRIIANGNVGIQVQNPLATLHVGGDLRVDGNIITATGTFKNTPENPKKTIRRLASAKVELHSTDETVILEDTVTQVALPRAQTENLGVLLIIKNLGSKKVSLTISYKDLSNRDKNTLDRNSVVWLQSDGIEWQQIR